MFDQRADRAILRRDLNNRDGVPRGRRSNARVPPTPFLQTAVWHWVEGVGGPNNPSWAHNAPLKTATAEEPCKWISVRINSAWISMSSQSGSSQPAINQRLGDGPAPSASFTQSCPQAKSFRPGGRFRLKTPSLHLTRACCTFECRQHFWLTCVLAALWVFFFLIRLEPELL